MSDTPEPTVRNLVNAYLDLREAEFAAGRFGAGMMNRLHRVLGRFAEAYGERPARTIRPSDVTTWLLKQATWKSDHVRAASAQVVRGLFLWAESEDLIVKNPIRGLKPCWDPLAPRGPILPTEYDAIMHAARFYLHGPGAPPGKERFRRELMDADAELRRRPEGLNRAEAAVVFSKRKEAAAWLLTELVRTGRAVKRGERWYADISSAVAPIPAAPVKRRRRPHTAFRRALFFLAQTGARTCEMRAAEWQFLDWDAGILRLPTHKTYRKSRKPRLIPLSRRLLRYLRVLHRGLDCPAKGAIFCNSRGGPWSGRAFHRLFAQFAAMAGDKVRSCVTPYSLRHGFCVQALERGLGERQIADVLGHASSRYVAWYGAGARENPEYLRGIVDRVHDTHEGEQHGS